MPRVIIIEDSKLFLDYAGKIVWRLGYEVVSAMSLRTAKPIIAKAGIEYIVLSDFRLPDGDAAKLLKWMRGDGINNTVVIMTQYFDAPPAIASMKLGAIDFIDKNAFDIKIKEVLKDISARNKARSSFTKPIFEHRFYVDIRRRKNDDRTYFLNEMRERLNEKMKADDRKEAARR